MSEEALGKIPTGTVLTDSNKKKWILGSFIGIDGSGAAYEAAEYKGEEIPEQYPELIKVKPHGDKTLSLEIDFFKEHGNPKEISKWLASNDHNYEYLGLPYYLGSAKNVIIADINLDFLVLERYGSNLETLLAEHGNILSKSTVLKIAYHILAVLEYLHRRDIVHGHIQASNIRIDLYDERIVYVLPEFCAVNKCDSDSMLFRSEYQHVGVLASTKRGDFESLLYNLIDWSGGILPWKNANLNDVKDMKVRAFEDPEQFLQEAFQRCACEDPSECSVARRCIVSGKPVAASECLQAIRELMEQVVSMDKTCDCKPNYKAIEKILKKRLLNMYQVPTSKLQFSVPTCIGDEDQDEKLSRGRRKSVETYISGISISVDTLALIIAENCSSFDEVDAFDNKYYGVLDVIVQMKQANRIMYAAKPGQIREAWEWNTQKLRTKVVEQWRLKGINPGSYKAWKRAKDKRNETKRITTGASIGDKKKTSLRNHESIASKNKDVVTTQSLYSSELKRKRDQHSADSRHNSRRIKRLKPDNSMNKTLQEARSDFVDSDEDDGEDARSASVSESNEDDGVDARSASASESNEDDGEDARSVSASESNEDDGEEARSASASESNEDDGEGARSASASDCESDEDDGENARSASASELNEDGGEDARSASPESDVQTPISSASRKLHSTDYDIDADSFAPKRRELATKLALESNEVADESVELFSEDTVTEAMQETNRTDDQTIERRRSVSVDREPWSDTYEWFNAWLGFREQTLAVFEPISLEPEVKTRQTFQVRVLRDEFSLQLYRLRRLMNVLAELPSDSDDVQKLSQMQRRWLNQLVWLEERAEELDDENLSQLRDVLQDQETVAWLIKELESKPEKPLITTDREALRQQHEQYQTIYQRIRNKKAQINMLLTKGRSAVIGSENHKNITAQQLFLDVVESQWNCLKKWSSNNHDRLMICVDHSEKYYEAQNLLLRWLTKAEGKLECLKPSSLNELKKIRQELSSFSNVVQEKSDSIVECTDLGHTFIGAIDEDEGGVLKNKLIIMKDRWDKLNSRLIERRNTLKYIHKHYILFSENLIGIKDKIQFCDNGLASFYASGGTAKDLKIYLHIMELDKKIVSTRELAIDLVSKAGQQGIDANYLMDEVNHVAASSEGLKAKLADTCKKILEPHFLSFVQGDNNIMRLQGELSKLKVIQSNVESVLGPLTNAAKSAGSKIA